MMLLQFFDRALRILMTLISYLFLTSKLVCALHSTWDRLTYRQSAMYNPASKRENRIIKSLIIFWAVTCSDHVMPAGQQLCNVVVSAPQFGALPGDETRNYSAGRHRSRDHSIATAHKSRMRTEGRPVTVSGYVTCAAAVTREVASQTAWCQYCLSRMTTDYLHLSLPSSNLNFTLKSCFRACKLRYVKLSS